MEKSLTALPSKQAICHGCELARDGGSSISLPGGWVANQYGGEGTYLGWLALQPRRHVMAFQDLNDTELRHFGSNIRLAEQALRSYFAEPVVRLYAVYFFEFPDDGYHLHVHLIPRLESFGILGWETPNAVKSGKVAKKYTIRSRDDAKVQRLMQHLHTYFA